MMPTFCRSCKYYCTTYKKIYHGTVEGCACQNDKPYPKCFEEKGGKNEVINNNPGV